MAPSCDYDYRLVQGGQTIRRREGPLVRDSGE